MFHVVGGGVGRGGPRHKKHAQTGVFSMCFMLWEVSVVPDTRMHPNGRVFCFFYVLNRRGREGDAECWSSAKTLTRCEPFDV